MKLRRREYFLINIIFMIIFMFIIATVNLKLNRMPIKLKFYIIPIILGMVFGIVITGLSIRKTKYLEEKIRKKTKQLEYYASMDEMTNTYNRRMGMKMLKYHFLLSKRYKKIFSICYLDINGLKFVNDTFGHNKGDEMIKKISEMLRLSVRESDIVARMGGDEFLIVLPHCCVEGAKKVIKRLTERMVLYNEMQEKNYKLSVSFGFSESLLLGEKTIEDMLIEADKGMYRMKKLNTPPISKDKQFKSLDIVRKGIVY